jgi:aspartate/methionine/tyrosine aminotransferase
VSRCRDAALTGLKGISFTPPRGSFYFTIPIQHDEEKAAARLLEKHGILVHPGYFYDIRPDHLVMTFIDDPDALATHFAKIAEVASL